MVELGGEFHEQIVWVLTVVNRIAVCGQFAVMSQVRIVFQGDRQSLAIEADKRTTGVTGRQLESVFLDRVAPNRVVPRLKTVAGGTE